MNPPVRNFVAAPLLLVALAISYLLIESLQGEPAPGERAAWITGRLITAAFVLYFVAGYFLIVARKYVVMAILTLWAGHLLILAPFLGPCEGSRNFDRFREMMGFGVREFAVAIALVAILSSVALFLRYRVVDSSRAADRRTLLRYCVAGAAIGSVALSAVAYWMVPLLREAYSDLPTQTLVLLATYRYCIVLPLACGVAFLYVMGRDQYSEAQLRIALNSALGLIIVLNVASSAFMSAALSPLRTMGCVV